MGSVGLRARADLSPSRWPGDDKTYPDGWIAEEAIARLKDAASAEKPFYLAVGFTKPHLPFAAPRPYFEEMAKAKPPLPAATAKPTFPTNWHNRGEFRGCGQTEGDAFATPAAAADSKIVNALRKRLEAATRG